MKKLVVIIALALFLKPIFPVAEYVINYDYISKVLCINKAQPKLKCNGKCHLMNELAKASENDKPISSDKKDNTKQQVEVLFYHEIKSLLIEQISFACKEKVEDNYSNFYLHTSSCLVFHPPTIIS